MPENEPEDNQPQNLPEPIARKENEQSGWLAAFTPENAKRLITGIGHITGKAARLSNSVSQTMRDNKARNTVSDAIANRIAEGIRNADPQFERAFERESARLLREQQTLDDIAEIVTETVATKAQAEFKPGELDDDWLYQYEAAAKGFSSDRMKHTFARILAGEILAPGSFSPATLRTLTTLSADDARLISTFVSMGYVFALLPNVPKEAVPPPMLITAGISAGSNGLSDFGLSYSDLTSLQQCGVISHDLNTYRTYQERSLTMLPAFIGSTFARIQPSEQPSPEREIRLQGILLTKVGAELVSVADKHPAPVAYLEKLRDRLKSTHKLQLLYA